MAARIIAFPRGISETSAGQGLPSNCETGMESMASAVGSGCVRGATLMIGLEAAAGLGLYALWQLLQLLH
jgi:hypothetical protein